MVPPEVSNGERIQIKPWLQTPQDKVIEAKAEEWRPRIRWFSTQQKSAAEVQIGVQISRKRETRLV